MAVGGRSEACKLELHGCHGCSTVERPAWVREKDHQVEIDEVISEVLVRIEAVDVFGPDLDPARGAAVWISEDLSLIVPRLTLLACRHGLVDLVRHVIVVVEKRNGFHR